MCCESLDDAHRIGKGGTAFSVFLLCSPEYSITDQILWSIKLEGKWHTNDKINPFTYIYFGL